MAARQSPLPFFLLIGITAILSLGCAIPQGTPSAATYILETPITMDEDPTSPDGQTVVVLPPKAASGYNTALMAYQRHPRQLEYFSRHRWADQPNRMLWPLLVAALEKNGHFRVVLSNQSASRNSIILASEILRLRQEFTAQASTVDFALRIELSGFNDNFLSTKIFTDSEPVLTMDPVAGVQAANRILTRLLPKIADWCATTVGQKKF